jgi:hypothetical protein
LDYFEEFGLTDERRTVAVPGRAKPDVTYSRIPEPPRRVARPRKAEPEGPFLAAVEVPLIDAPYVAEAPRVAPEIRAPVDGPPVMAEPGPFFEKETRPRRRLRPLTILTFLAVAIGVGILAATFGTVTKPTMPGANDAAAVAPAGEVPATTAAAPATPAKTGADAEVGTPGVRTISLTGGNDVPAAPAPQPVPPSRPEHAATTPDAGAPAAADVDASPADSVKTPAPAELRKSMPAASGTAKPASPPVKTASKPANDNDEYIARIERTLAGKHAGPGAPPASLKPPPGAVAAPVATHDAEPATTSAAMAVPDPARGGILDLSTPPPGVPIPPADIPNVPPAKSFQ